MPIKLLNYERPEWASIIAAYGTWVIGYIIFSMSPLLMQAYVAGLGMPESKAGFLISSDFAGIGVASILSGYSIHRMSNKMLAIVGSALVLICNGLSIKFLSHDILAAIRFVAGLGTGMVLVGGAATLSKHKRTESMFGTVNLFTAATMSIAIAVGGYALKVLGGPGVYFVIIAFVVAMLPFLIRLPSDIHSPADNKDKATLPNIALGYIFILGFVVALICQNAGWIFKVRLGIESGFTLVESSSIIGFGTILAVSGAAIAAWIGIRFGRVIPMAIGVIALGAPWLFMCLVPSPKIFVIGSIVQSIAFLFCVSFLLGTAAAMDSWGRWAGVASGFQLVGSTVGPAFGGGLIQAGGLAYLGWGVFGGTVIALLPMLFATKRLEAIGGIRTTPSSKS